MKAYSSSPPLVSVSQEKLDRTQMSSSPYLRELMTAVCKAAVKDLLRIFFHCMCDKDVSSEDAVCKSGTSKDPADQLGNGVALKTVTAFFTWLREAESQDN